MRIVCSNISKQYAKQSLNVKDSILNIKKNSIYTRGWAIRNISFNLKEGHSLGIVGHNGTGKTTLLSILMGSISPDDGEIKVNGKVCSLIELGTGFHPDLTGIENIYLYGSILGLRISTIKEKIADIVDFSELGSSVNQQLRTFSSGMIARLGFAVIAFSDPDIILVDEVLAVGDLNFQKKCVKHMLSFKKNGGSLIIVSHDPNTIKSLCEETIVLDEGKLVFKGKSKLALKKYHDIMLKRHDEKR
jgi:ABC-type polysaccharide/polyol phosphate transport system ATPase subunit